MTGNHSWEKFLREVEKMREAQKVYFRQRSPSSLSAAKYLEKTVDNMIKRHRTELARESQPELIGGNE